MFILFEDIPMLELYGNRYQRRHVTMRIKGKVPYTIWSIMGIVRIVRRVVPKMLQMQLGIVSLKILLDSTESLGTELMDHARRGLLQPRSWRYHWSLYYRCFQLWFESAPVSVSVQGRCPSLVSNSDGLDVIPRILQSYSHKCLKTAQTHLLRSVFKRSKKSCTLNGVGRRASEFQSTFFKLSYMTASISRVCLLSVAFLLVLATAARAMEYWQKRSHRITIPSYIISRVKVISSFLS